jgi:RNA polymerase sigma-70 factor (ECF subfamily)
LVHQHWDAVYRLTYRLCGNLHQAEDLTQETFLRAIDRQEALADGVNVRAWLLRVATNLFVDACRRRKSVQFEALAQDPPREPQSSGIEDAELTDLLNSAVAELPEQARAVLALRVEQDLSFRQIGQLLSITEETARWHMMQARRQLLRKLEGKI